MSRKNKRDGIINLLRDKLERESWKITDKEEKITPYHIIEALKAPFRKGDELTYIGRLIKESLGDPEDIEAINWIAFHFDFPGQEFSYSERDTRNWIAVKSGEQELVDGIHRHVREKYHEIQDIYAPSVALAQITRLRSGDKKLVKSLQRRRWLYRLGYKGDERPRSSPPGGVPGAGESGEDTDLICFQEEISSEGERVSLVSQRPVFENRTVCGLGELLDETEEEALRKFRRFKSMVYDASDGKVSLNCDFYVRLPLFFYGAEQEYMTETLVALSHKRKNGKILNRLEMGRIVQILDDIAPSLKTCVSLINSQVAYSLGEVTRRDKMAGLLHAVIRHDISNFAGAVDGSVSQLIEYRDALEEKETLEILNEIRANVALSTMFIDLDFLWNVNVKGSADNFIPVNQIREELDKSWQFSSVLNCEFSGDWDSESLVPKVCRIVLSSLLRNAINNNDDASIRLDCRVENESVSFGCLSEKEFPEVWKTQAFEAPLSARIPAHNRGLWICRYIAESLKGEFYLAPPLERYKTHIRFGAPNF